MASSSRRRKATKGTARPKFTRTSDESRRSVLVDRIYHKVDFHNLKSFIRGKERRNIFPLGELLDSKEEPHFFIAKADARVRGLKGQPKRSFEIFAFDYLKKLGLPVPDFYLSVKIKLPENHSERLIIMSDLSKSSEGREMHLFDLKNFSMENVEEMLLRTEVVDAKDLLEQMFSENGFAYKLRKVIGSGLFGDRLEVFENSFFLQVDPATRAGRWVLGDLDHLKFGALELKAMDKFYSNLKEMEQNNNSG